MGREQQAQRRGRPGRAAKLPGALGGHCQPRGCRPAEDREQESGVSPSLDRWGKTGILAGDLVEGKAPKMPPIFQIFRDRP